VPSARVRGIRPPRETITVRVPPAELEVRGAKVTVVEVHGYDWLDGRRYLVSCFIEMDGYRSPLFHLDVRDEDELARKLAVEIAKMRLAVFAGFTRFLSPAT
jgi:hypothetical protein